MTPPVDSAVLRAGFLHPNAVAAISFLIKPGRHGCMQSMYCYDRTLLSNISRSRQTRTSARAEGEASAEANSDSGVNVRGGGHAASIGAGSGLGAKRQRTQI
jgi:hypothetical protein